MQEDWRIVLDATKTQLCFILKHKGWGSTCGTITGKLFVKGAASLKAAWHSAFARFCHRSQFSCEGHSLQICATPAAISQNLSMTPSHLHSLPFAFHILCGYHIYGMRIWHRHSKWTSCWKFLCNELITSLSFSRQWRYAKWKPEWDLGLKYARRFNK